MLCFFSHHDLLYQILIFAFFLFSVCLQLRFKDIQHAVGWTLSGKSGFSSWPAEATKRIIVVIVTTCTLLIIRLQIMGSKLPVFTRLVLLAARYVPELYIQQVYVDKRDILLSYKYCNGVEKVR